MSIENINLQRKTLIDFNVENETKRLSVIHNEVVNAEQLYQDTISKIDNTINKWQEKEESFIQLEADCLSKIKILQDKFVSLKFSYNESEEKFNKLSSLITPLENSVKNFKGDVERLKKEIQDIEGQKADKAKEFEEEKTKYSDILHNLGEEIITKKKELVNISFDADFYKKELENNLKKINKENALLDVRKKDLDIYEARLKNNKK